MPPDPFSITRQTIAFLGFLAAFELASVLVFPAIAIFFAVVALALAFIVWLKAGIRTRKWLWWNPIALPLTQAEGAIALSAALLVSVSMCLSPDAYRIAGTC